MFSNVVKNKPKSISESILQGMSNIMQKYQGHTIKDFFGQDPMTAAQFFVLNAQLKYEYDEEVKERKRLESKSKKGRKR